jgi:hypothetical protein
MGAMGDAGDAGDMGDGGDEIVSVRDMEISWGWDASR